MFPARPAVDVLLTHSYHLAYDRKQIQRMQPYPPLATLYAAAVLRENGYSVAVSDSMLQEPIHGFRDALRQHHPKVVALYEDDFNFLTKMCLTKMRELAWRMIDEARVFGARIAVHGSDASDHPLDYLSHGSDCVLLGESEGTLLEVVGEFLANGDPGAIPGVASLEKYGPKTSLRLPPRHVSRPHVALPFPARDLIDMNPYRIAWQSTHDFYSTNLIASRGCPFRCNWCAKPIFGDRFQVRPAAAVASEMALLQHQYGAEHLWFADDIFGLNHHWVKEFADEVEAEKCVMPFKIQARADLLDAAVAQALKRAGCSEVWMGVESGSQPVLDAMDKGLRVEEVIAARQHLKREGIKACFFLQFGYPGESWDELKRTVNLVRETRPDDIGVSLSYPLPNTRFYERVQEQLGAKRNWSDSADLCVMFKGAYTDQFYRSIRDALHDEVDSWKHGAPSAETLRKQAETWRQIELREPLSRNLDATEPWDLSEEESVQPRACGDSLVSISNAALASGNCE
jgi:anaerobic magnesium-protoporphyrin IX monomethyl ester cyclase